MRRIPYFTLGIGMQIITTITRIPPGPAARVLALIHLVLGAIVSAVGFALFSLQDSPEPYSGLWPIVPLIYTSVLFAISFITVLLYNLVARLFGGIKIVCDDESHPIDTLSRH